MSLLIFFKALLVGFLISFPIGPIGILCLRRMLTDGPLAGVASGLGAATADAIYGCIAAMGLSFVSSYIFEHQFFFRFVGGLVLIALGTTIVISKQEAKLKSRTHTDIFHSYLSTFLLTFTNPITLLSFMGIFTILGISVNSYENISEILLVVLGVFLGASLWWISMAASITVLQLRINMSMVKFINIFAGAFIILCGVLALISLFGPLSINQNLCQPMLIQKIFN